MHWLFDQTINRSVQYDFVNHALGEFQMYLFLFHWKMISCFCMLSNFIDILIKAIFFHKTFGPKSFQKQSYEIPSRRWTLKIHWFERSMKNYDFWSRCVFKSAHWFSGINEIRENSNHLNQMAHNICIFGPVRFWWWH